MQPTDPGREALVAVREAIARGDIAEANSLCSEFLDKNPGDFEAALLGSIIAFKNRRQFSAEQILTKLLERNPNSVEACVWLAKIYGDSLRYLQGVDLLTRALKAEPDSVDALTVRANFYIPQWRNVEALELLTRALTVDPKFAPALDSRGVVLYHDGFDAEAEKSFRSAIDADPNWPSAYANLGSLLGNRGATAEAEQILESAFARFHNSASKLVDLAETCWGIGLAPECVRALSRAIELEPQVIPTRRNLARVLLDTGEIEQAYAEYRRTIEEEPGLSNLYLELTMSGKLREEDRPLIEQMRNLIRSPRLTPNDRQPLHYALGKAYDDLGDYRNAMQHFDEANGIARMQFARRTFDRVAHTKLIDQVSTTFKSSFFKEHPNLGNESDKPIFIIGMIRSGTTLVDQIVSSHPLVGAAGELTYLADRFGETFKFGIEPNEELVHEWAKGYLNRLRVAAPNFPRVTDKLPTNFFYLGAILSAFPNAKFIHCKRNALDNCLSIYVTPNIANYTHSFSDIAFYYREYQRLMVHWRRVLPSGSLFEVGYEEMVADREPVVRKLIEFLQLPWDDAVLSHEANRGAIATPSVWQARQPIYKTSVERWRRYEPWIRDLLREFPTLATPPT